MPEPLFTDEGVLPLYEDPLPLFVVTPAGLRWLDCDETDEGVRPAAPIGRLDELVPLLTVPVAGMNHMEDPRTLLAREYTLLLYMKSLWWMECMRQFHFTAESVVL